MHRDAVPGGRNCLLGLEVRGEGLAGEGFNLGDQVWEAKLIQFSTDLLAGPV